MLCSFNESTYKAFSTLSLNEGFVANLIYNKIKATVPGCSDIFVNTHNQFVQWFTNRNPENCDFSYFDSTLIEYLYRSEDFTNYFKDDLEDIDSLAVYLVSLWSSETKTLKKNMSKVHMIYLRYVRFLNSESGYDFLYGKSVELIPESSQMESGLASVDKPFYEAYNYKLKRLAELKKYILLTSCSNPLEVCAMNSLWNLTFSETESFNYKAVERDIWSKLGESSVSHTKLFNLLKKLNIKMIKAILKGNNLEDYFDNDQTFEINGNICTLRAALEKHLIDMLADEQKDKKKRPTNIGIVDSVKRFCNRNGIIYDTIQTSCSNVLIKVKADNNFNRKNNWKLYFFKGGGWYCFSTGMQGFITDLIPENIMS